MFLGGHDYFLFRPLIKKPSIPGARGRFPGASADKMTHRWVFAALQKPFKILYGQDNLLRRHLPACCKVMRKLAPHGVQHTQRNTERQQGKQPLRHLLRSDYHQVCSVSQQNRHPSHTIGRPPQGWSLSYIAMLKTASSRPATISTGVSVEETAVAQGSLVLSTILQ